MFILYIFKGVMSIINKVFGVNYIKYGKNGFNRVPNVKSYKKILANMKFM